MAIFNSYVSLPEGKYVSHVEMLRENMFNQQCGVVKHDNPIIE
jgi:hypothetical protein